MNHPTPIIRSDNKFHRALILSGTGGGVISMSGFNTGFLIHKKGNGSGGISLSGSATAIHRKYGSGSSTLTLRSSNNIKNSSGSGSIALGGNATATHRKFGSGSGSIILGSSNTNKAGNGSGSLTIGGSNTARIHRKYGSGSGAVSLGGSNPVYLLRKYGSGSASIALGGSNSSFLLRKYGSGSGSVTLGGSATATKKLALSATVDDNTADGSGAGSGPFTTNTVTAAGHDGTPGYSYSWARISGNATIGISSASAAAVSWSASGTAPETKSAVWRCTITDGMGSTATVDVTVTIDFTVVFSVALDTNVATGTRVSFGSVTCFTNYVTGTPTGGQSPYTYLWEKQSGDTVGVSSAGLATTRWQETASPVVEFHAVYRLKVTDNLGAIAYSENVDVSLYFESLD